MMDLEFQSDNVGGVKLFWLIFFYLACLVKLITVSLCIILSTEMCVVFFPG